MRQFWEVADFIRAMGRQIRFGELSRANLQLLRFELRSETAECDWIARPADEWDRGLPPHIGDANASTQALQDAIALRKLLFRAFPGVMTASLRVFRQSAAGPLELIIAGTTDREQDPNPPSCSLAMRAKLLGFQFWLEGGILAPLQSEEYELSF